MRRIKELGGNAGLNSNGSRVVAWWDEATPYLDLLILTYHIEFTRMVHFVAVANRLLDREVTTHVNLTMLPDRFDESAELLLRCCRDAKELA